MSDIQAEFSLLKQTTDPAVADAILQLIESGEDHELNRINVLDFSKRTGLDEERVISGFLHASRLGLFDLSWNVLCPGCGGVLGAHGTLKSLRPDDYHCALCACGYEASVDEQVEVAFTVSPRVRRIAAHDPNTLPVWEYYKQVFWSSGIDIDKEGFDTLAEEVHAGYARIAGGRKGGAVAAIAERIHHRVRAGDACGAIHRCPGRADQGTPAARAGVRQDADADRGTRTMRPGPLRLSLDNQADVRVLPSVFIAGDALHHLIGKRKPFLTAKRMLSNQTFRDVFKADNLNVDQRLKITSLTFLFTDLKGSTALYERVGDLAAFDLVRAHFHALLEIISSEKGAVVKTIGDAVMATFIRPEHAIVAGLRMRAAMDALNVKRGTDDLVVKIGIHEGPCLAVMLNERQDYFGQTVNIAARVQSLSTSQEIHITGPVIDSPAVAAILDESVDQADPEGSGVARYRRQDGGVRDTVRTRHPGLRAPDAAIASIRYAQCAHETRFAFARE